jgi:hypothetical protein
MAELDEAFNVRSIQLEPRLQEYLREKKFNQENDISSDIPEEQKFGITPTDLKTIKRYMKGHRTLYSQEKLFDNDHFVKPIIQDFESDNDFKLDPRYKRIEKKMKAQKDAVSRIRDYSGIDSDYEIFHRSNPYDHMEQKKPQRISKPYDDPNNRDLNRDFEPMDGMTMMDSRDLAISSSRPYGNKKGRSQKEIDDEQVSKYRYDPNRRGSNPNIYNHPPQISYRNYLRPQMVNGGLQHNYSTNDVIGRLDRYNKHLDQSYNYSDMDDYSSGMADVDTHHMTPKSRTGTRRENYNRYQSVPFMYGNGMADVSVEDSLRGGIRDSSKKSLGFKNPFENQFDYISGDISDPDHTVMMWPSNSRGADKEIARPNSNAMKAERRMRNNY